MGQSGVVLYQADPGAKSAASGAPSGHHADKTLWVWRKRHQEASLSLSFSNNWHPRPYCLQGHFWRWGFAVHFGPNLPSLVPKTESK